MERRFVGLKVKVERREELASVVEEEKMGEEGLQKLQELEEIPPSQLKSWEKEERGKAQGVAHRGKGEPDILQVFLTYLL